MTDERLREALKDIVRHGEMPDGESWEQAYSEVVNIARAALTDSVTQRMWTIACPDCDSLPGPPGLTDERCPGNKGHAWEGSSINMGTCMNCGLAGTEARQRDDAVRCATCKGEGTIDVCAAPDTPALPDQVTVTLTGEQLYREWCEDPDGETDRAQYFGRMNPGDKEAWNRLAERLPVLQRQESDH